MTNFIVANSGINPTPTPTPNKSLTPTPTPSVTSTPIVVTVTPSPTSSITPTPTLTTTPTPTPTSSPRPIVITEHPQPQTVDIETAQSTQFSTTAQTDSINYYSWQYSDDNGSTWNYLTASGTPSISGVSVLYLNNIQSSQDNYQYRCEITNGIFTDTTNAATLTVIYDIVITSDPNDAIVSPSGTATFSIGAE